MASDRAASRFFLSRPDAARALAAAPTAAGQAIDVPLISVCPVGTVEMTATQGPMRSTSGPMLLKPATKLFLSVPYGLAMSSTSAALARTT